MMWQVARDLAARCSPRRWRGAALGLALAVSATMAQAAPMLSVGGTGDLGHTILINQAAAVSFSLTQAFSNVTVTADLTPLFAPQGGVFLMSALGPAAGIGNIVAGVDFSLITFAGGATVLFTGLNLGVGDYFLVVANDQAGPALSRVLWNGTSGTSGAIVNAAAGVTDGVDFFEDDTAAFPPASSFTTVLPGDRSAHFTLSTVDRVTNGIPEPDSWILVILGTGALLLVRRRGGGTS